MHDMAPRRVADWFRVTVAGGSRKKGHHSEEHFIVIDLAAATLGDTTKKVRESDVLTMTLDDCVVTLFFFDGLGQGENSPRHWTGQHIQIHKRV
jgi:hypothetical protein